MIPIVISTTTAAAAADPMISGNWLIAVIGAIASAAALLIGKMQGERKAASTRLESPIPTVPTSKVSTPPSWDAHRALADRVARLEDDLRALATDMKLVKDAQAEQFRQLMVAGAEREIRISDKIDGFARAIHTRIDTHLKPQRRQA